MANRTRIIVLALTCIACEATAEFSGLSDEELKKDAFGAGWRPVIIDAAEFDSRGRKKKTAKALCPTHAPPRPPQA
jgi:hypothetical protein